jgi:hypothetical protein
MDLYSHAVPAMGRAAGEALVAAVREPSAEHLTNWVAAEIFDEDRGECESAFLIGARLFSPPNATETSSA